MRCKKLIEKNLKNKSTYAGTLANHIPMSLVAMDYLNASQITLHNFYKKSKKRMGLEKHPKNHKNKTIHPLHDLGNKEEELSWRSYFEHKLEETAPREILNEWFPTLAPSIAAGAFHPFIRVSYALETHNHEEFIAAMAYWASHYEMLDSTQAQKVYAPSLREIFTNATDENFSHPIPISGKTIFDKLKSASLSPEFNKRAIILDMEFEQYLSEGSLSAAHMLDKDLDFTALHVTSSFMALRVIGSYLTKENKKRAVQHHFYAVMCAHQAINAPRLPITIQKAEKSSTLEWEEINKSALSTYDDHVLKLTYLCLKEAQHYKRPFYKDIAWRYIQHHNALKP